MLARAGLWFYIALGGGGLASTLPLPRVRDATFNANQATKLSSPWPVGRKYIK